MTSSIPLAKHHTTNIKVGSVDTPAKPVELEVDYENRTVIFRLILKKDWKGVIQRAKAFPAEVATWIVTKGFNAKLQGDRV
jgi:hypothetical protein